ncbi:hypothetical protein ACVW0P_004042 [Mucilaginibacter sp. UYNi724]
MKIKLLLFILCTGLLSCKKEVAGDVMAKPDPIVSTPEIPSTEIATAYLLVITANADTTISDTVSLSK